MPVGVGVEMQEIQDKFLRFELNYKESELLVTSVMSSSRRKDGIYIRCTPI